MMLAEWILTIAIFLPLVGAGVVALLPADAHSAIRRVAMGVAVVTLVVVTVAMVLFCQAGGGGEYVLEQNVSWVGGSDSSVDIRYHVGLDGISAWLLALTALLTPLAIWASYSSIRERVREYYALMLMLHTGMLGVFCAMDLLLFYVFFEFTLVPLFFLIGIWGGPEKTRAAHKFFIFTLAGSMLTFGGILYLAWVAYERGGTGQFTFDLATLYGLAANGLLSAGEQWWLFLALFAGFAIKVPLFPVHTWLPLAHTEAPTAGSVILAGVLLKLGTYGFLRFNLPMLPDATVKLAPLMAVLALAGIIYGALCAWVQRDVKKLVAYSSVSHLGFCMLGMFSLTMAGLSGSLLYMVNHGLATGALFLVIGMIYERYHTRDIDSVGGLARRMPILSFFLILFVLASIGLPGLNGFVSEFLVLLGTFTSAKTVAIEGVSFAGPLGVPYAVVAATGIVLSAIYMLWMCRCVLFGPLKEPDHTPDLSGGLKVDLTAREVGVLAPIAVLCILLGVLPGPVMRTMEPSLERHVLARIVKAPPPTVAPESTIADRSDESVGRQTLPVSPRAAERVGRLSVVPGSSPAKAANVVRSDRVYR